MSLETGNLELQSPSPLRKSTAFGTLLMLASAFLFSVLDVLIKTMGPEFRVWDIAFFGIFFLGEITTWRFWIGGLMILGSVVILNRVKTKATSVSKSRVPEPQATM